MNLITSMKKCTHPDMPGVTIYTWENIQSGKPQEVVVNVDPGATIPPHQHSVDAYMIIVSGEAEVLFDEDQLHEHGMTLNKKIASTGDQVYFKAYMMHGFKASQKGLRFLSINGGIVDENSDKWDYQMQ
jgi:quercetin dioxygenase-like cupin family protein